MRKVTKYLGEGVECKEILIQAKLKLEYKDSIIKIQEQRIVNLQVKDTLKEKRIIVLQEDNEVCNTEYNKQGKQLIKTKKQNKALITSNGLLLTLLLIILI